MNHVPIVTISDNKLCFAVGTLFTNLVKVKDKTTFYDFFAVLAPDTAQENIDKIRKVAEMWPDDCSITIIKMDNRFDDIENKTGYIANACAYKMCLAEILEHLDKIIYLDTDILVFDDLLDLYNTDLTDAYIAGIPSLEHYLTRRDLAQKLNIPNMAQYINAGVMVMNLAKLRSDNIEPKLQKLIGTYSDSVDQHIFNRVCYGHIKLLPPWFNVFQSAEYMYNTSTALVEMSPADLQHVREHPTIYHYTDKMKPWLFFNLKYHLIWFHFFEQSPFSDVALSFRFYPHSICNCPLLSQLYAPRNKKDVKWYKKLFSIDKENINGKKHTVLRILGLSFII